MELPHIGQTCVICKRDDYLPFKCSYCGKTVCVDHKTNHGYECALNKTIFQNSLQPDKSVAENLKQSCDYCKKITLKLELIECNHCSRTHCLYHRHQDQHECCKLAELIEENLREERERKECQRNALERLKMSQKQVPGRSATTNLTSISVTQSFKTTSDPKKKALEKRVRIMRIKSIACGPTNILDEDKLYFQVKFQHQPNSSLSKESFDNKTLCFYTTASHTIGRVVDWSAKELGLVNKNHHVDADELIFMKSLQNQEIPLKLDNQFTIQHYQNSNQLEDGDELIMTYYKNQ